MSTGVDVASPVPSPVSLPPVFRWLIAGLIALHACMAATRVTGSLWVLRQGHDERLLGVMLSLFAVAPILLSLWAGRMADRHGLQRPVRLATVMGLVGTAACAVWPSLPTLGLACLLTGGALGLAAVAIQREAGQMAHEGFELKRIFAWIALGPALSNALAPLIVGLVIDHAGLRWAFAFGVLLPVLAWGLLSRVGRRLAQAPSSGHRSSGTEEPVWNLLKIRPLRALLLINLSMAAAWDAHTFAVPVVGHLREMSASQIGLIFSSFAVAATAVRLLIVGWASRIDEITVLRGAMALAAAVLAAYIWLPGLVGLMLGSALLGLALGSVQPMVLSMLHQVTPAHRQGQALGLRMLVTNAATVGMPVVFGLLSAGLATAAPLWLMAGLLLVAQAAAVGRVVRPPSPDDEAVRRSSARDPGMP